MTQVVTWWSYMCTRYRGWARGGIARVLAEWSYGGELQVHKEGRGAGTLNCRRMSSMPRRSFHRPR